MYEKNDVVAWLNDGKEHSAVKLLKQCEYSVDFIDMGISFNGPDVVLVAVYIRCPRHLYQSLAKYKKETDQIEEAINILANGVNTAITSLNWVALVPNVKNGEIKISSNSIKELANIVSGDTKVSPYRSGPQLVEFFNGFLDHDVYGKGFPTRWYYAEEKIKEANEKGIVDKIIEAVLDPRNFFNTDFDIEKVVGDFNRYIEFDELVVRKSGAFYRVNRLNQKVITSSLISLSTEINIQFIKEHLDKCDKKIEESDFSGAITNSRSLVENVLLEIESNLIPQGTKYNGDIIKLYGRVYKAMNLDPSKKEISDSVRQIFSGLISLISGLAGLRNSASDAHGSNYSPQFHHAKFAVNSAKTVSDFLVESYKYQVDKGLISPKISDD